MPQHEVTAHEMESIWLVVDKIKVAVTELEYAKKKTLRLISSSKTQPKARTSCDTLWYVSPFLLVQFANAALLLC